MPDQTEPLIDAGGQQPSRATPPTPRAAELVTSPGSEAPRVAGLAAAPVKPTPAEEKAAKIDEDRDEFIRNALPVAAALRKSGKPAEAKQLELVAQAIWQTKSMQPTPAPALAPTPGQELRVKDALASVLKAIDDNPAIRNMPETKRLRQAGKRLDQEGMLHITLRNGIVVSFVSNFTDNFNRTQVLATAAPEAKLATTQGAPASKNPAAVTVTEATAPAVTQPAPAPAPVPELVAPIAAGVTDEKARVATVLVTSAADAAAGKSMREVLTKRFEEAGAHVELVSSKPASEPTKSLAELKVSYRLDQPGIAPISALLDATALMPSAQLREQPGDQLARQQAARPEPARPAPPVHQPRDQQAQQQQAPQPRAGRAQEQQSVASVRATPAYELYAPTTDTGIVETRKLMSSDNPHLNMAMAATGEFGINPNVNQQRLLGDGLSTLSKFFDYALPTSGHKIAHVGLAEPGKLEKTEQGWKVVTKGKLAITDTEGNVFTPQVGPAKPLAPTPPVQVAQPVPGPPPAPSVAIPGPVFRVAELPTDLLAQAGVPVTELARNGQLQKLLAGQKTDLIPDLQLPGLAGQPTKFAAKLVLSRDEQGVASLHVDLPKRELQIPPQVMGKEITPVMQQQLQTTGVVPLSDGFRDGQGQPLSGYLAVDQEMKRVVYVRPEGIQLPQEVYGARLSPAQQQSLREGRPTRVEGMTHPGDKQLVDALVQLDPLKKAFTFRDTMLRHEQVIGPSPTLAARRPEVWR
jgi:hypothetical protein